MPVAKVNGIGQIPTLLMVGDEDEGTGQGTDQSWSPLPSETRPRCHPHYSLILYFSIRSEVRGLRGTCR